MIVCQNKFEMTKSRQRKPFKSSDGKSMHPITGLQKNCAGYDACGLIVINVSGLRYELNRQIFEQYPETLLGNSSKRNRHYDPERKEYFFDRSRPSFDAILHYYKSGGVLKRPFNVPVEVFVDELEFYKLGHEAKSKFLMNEGICEETQNELQHYLWTLFENPESSLAAKMIFIFSFIMILASIGVICLEAISFYEPVFKEGSFILETICITWFMSELCIRFLTSPKKAIFITDLSNFIDFIVVLPYFIILTLPVIHRCEKTLDFFSILLKFTEFIRILRIFKLFRHSKSMQIFCDIIYACKGELSLPFCYSFLIVTFLGSAMYFIENGFGEYDYQRISDIF